MLLAKQIATLDYLSGGRFIFGIGAGWNREESEILGGDFIHRWTQVRDAILAMKELWTKDEAEYHGKYYDFPLVRCNPKPAQKPHPPVLLGGDSKNLFKRAVAWGDGWLPGVHIRDVPSGAAAEKIKQGRKAMDELASAAGRDPGSLGITMFVGIDPIYHNIKSLADEISAYDGINSEVIKAYADLGVERMVFQARTNRGEEALRVLERLAERVLN
jgi:alkanesulfonate monooxygenase SsuD/methylene tetrahydromethanopterin reductase-like flavin-dependent oxidoreductase (luciferase family)